MAALLPHAVLIQRYSLETIHAVTHRVSSYLLTSVDGFIGWVSLSLSRTSSHFQVPFIPTVLH